MPLRDASTDTSAAPLAEGRAQLLRDSRIRWYHVLAALLSGLLTVFAWHSALTADETRAARRFERESERTIELLSDRLRRYEDVLRASVAKINANDGSLSRAEWQRYTDGLEYLSELPATSGLGIVFRVPHENLPDFVAEQRKTRPDFSLQPSKESDVHMPLTYVVSSRLVASTPGFDLVHDDARREAALDAGRSNKVRITRPVLPTSTPDPGFVMFAPFYRDGVNLTRQADIDPLARLEGWVAISVVGNELVNGLIDADRHSLHIAIHDGADVLIDEHDSDDPDHDPSPLFTAELDVPMYGRVWHARMQSGLAFRLDSDTRAPEAVLIGGLLIDALLIAMILVGTRRNRLTLELVDKRSHALSARAVQLRRINEELESFSFIISHDLKTPLSGIRTIADFIDEDVDQVERNAVAPSELRNKAFRLGDEVSRANALINGVMSYFHVGGHTEVTETCDTRELLEGLGRTLQVSAEQLRLEGDFPTLQTYRTRLEQVLANLIGNAFKYHDDAPRAVVRVSAEGDGDFIVFTVTDDGPGIEERHHAKIFELFGTLKNRPGVDSTGVGLAIVKRIVEQLGGRITVTSGIGNGTTFAFHWPREIDGKAIDDETSLPRAA